MKRMISRSLVVSAIALAAIGAGRAAFETARAQTQQSPAAPRFEVDPAWPKIPNNWQFGQVASVSVDGQDHVWVLQRPGTLGAEEKARAAPPLLEFDAAGTFVQAWGGPGQGFEWPASEHGADGARGGLRRIGGSDAQPRP